MKKRAVEIDGIITIKRRGADGKMRQVFKVELLDGLGHGRSFVIFNNKESRLTKTKSITNSEIFNRARELYTIARKMN